MVGSHWANKEAKASEVVYEATEDMYKEAAQKAGMLHTQKSDTLEED
jgi:hypothetical protein